MTKDNNVKKIVLNYISGYDDDNVLQDIISKYKQSNINIELRDKSNDIMAAYEISDIMFTIFLNVISNFSYDIFIAPILDTYHFFKNKSVTHFSLGKEETTQISYSVHFASEDVILDASFPQEDLDYDEESEMMKKLKDYLNTNNKKGYTKIEYKKTTKKWSKIERS